MILIKANWCVVFLKHSVTVALMEGDLTHIALHELLVRPDNVRMLH